MAKPRIRYHKHMKHFECFTWEDTPGESCFVCGDGATPSLAYAQWQNLMEVYLSDLAKEKGRE